MEDGDRTHAPDASAGPLVRFYLGQAPDDRGRMIDEIYGWDNDRLEYVHDYIQWLFPLLSRSNFNPGAPVLDQVQIEAFRSHPRLGQQLLRSFELMLRFYGLDLDTATEEPAVIRAGRWEQRKRNWLSPGNHNYLRITRILTSLRILGAPEPARAFFAALDEIYHSEDGRYIGTRTYSFWKSAVNGR